MRIAQERLTIETKPREIKEITGEVASWVKRQGIARGLLTMFNPAHLRLPPGSGELLTGGAAGPGGFPRPARAGGPGAL